MKHCPHAPIDTLPVAYISSSSTSFASRAARKSRNGLFVQATRTCRALLSVVVVAGLLASSSSAQQSTSAQTLNFVTRQTTTPGQTETGNTNITGTALIGQRLGVGTLSPVSTIEVHANSANPVAAIKAYNINGSGIGVWGESTGTVGYGLVGQADSTTGVTYGVGGQSDSDNGTGVYGYVPSASGVTWGVYGSAWSPNGYGVYGINHASTYGYGVYGENTNGDVSGYAIYSNGNLATTGHKMFQIDHPLDPENKVLNHYCTEGPEPINAYRGHVVLGANGEAWVTLPSYFEAINKDYEYQLTSIGGFAPVYVAEEIRNNRFLIAGGREGMKVSWRVEGVRNDPWVQRHGAPIEVEKSAEQRGKFLVPELYGQPPEMGIHFRP